MCVSRTVLQSSGIADIIPGKAADPHQSVDDLGVMSSSLKITGQLSGVGWQHLNSLEYMVWLGAHLPLSAQEYRTAREA